jgi:UDP-N-acetylglucosamine 1-carboxyvinyltransferase
LGVTGLGEYHITGGKKITGVLTINGGKNAILPIMASIALAGNESVIHHCPRISDTFVTMEILKAIGAKTKLEGTTLVADSSGATRTDVPEDLVQKMRSSIIFLGALLGRFKKVKISYPGGCEKKVAAKPVAATFFIVFLFRPITVHRAVLSYVEPYYFI